MWSKRMEGRREERWGEKEEEMEGKMIKDKEKGSKTKRWTEQEGKRRTFQREGKEKTHYKGEKKDKKYGERRCEEEKEEVTKRVKL